MKHNDLKLVKTGERTRPSIRERLSQWAGHTLKLLDPPPSAGFEIYMRWPGERVPPTPEMRRRWGQGRRDDNWILAA